MSSITSDVPISYVCPVSDVKIILLSSIVTVTFLSGYNSGNPKLIHALAGTTRDFSHLYKVKNFNFHMHM